MTLILTRFNSQIPNGIKRDLSQLRGCWKRLKLQSKKEHDLHRREAKKKTGGGKAPASPSEVSKLVADALPASFNRIRNLFLGVTLWHKQFALRDMEN